MKNVVVLIFFLFHFVVFASAQSFNGQLTVDEKKRTFQFYRPENLPVDKRYPLVIMLHGGGGTAAQMPRFTKFNLLADRDSFLVVYPDGYKHQWNDHRIGANLPSYLDDVKFIRVMIDYLVKKHGVDSTRIYATGISNGGMMSLYLAQELSEKIAAAACVCGSIPANYFSTYHLPRPVSVMIINGDADALVPYQGGPVGRSHWQRGAVVATDSTRKKLLDLLSCSSRDSVFHFPDAYLKDQCTASKVINRCNEWEVQLITVKGGGHTWPGGIQYLPKRYIGRLCKDFSASAEIWNFFRSQPAKR